MIVSQTTAFVIRLVLGAVFAVILTRAFYPGTAPIKIAGLAILLVGLAYLFDYLRNRKSGS